MYEEEVWMVGGGRSPLGLLKENDIVVKGLTHSPSRGWRVCLSCGQEVIEDHL